MATRTRDFAVVTGAGSGIGRAVASELSKEAVTVLAVGRRTTALENTVTESPGTIEVVSADVTMEAGRRSVVDTLGPDSQVKYLVHAAGISPIARLSEGDVENWRRVMATNVDACLFLTLALASKLSGGGRVLLVGSNSATKPRKGAAAYCTSKAASFMLHECLKLELAEQHILVTSAIPGPVDTEMVRAHVSADRATYPDGAEYARLLAEGKLIQPSVVGEFFRWLLTKSTDKSYCGCEWNIGDKSHHSKWLRRDTLW